MRKDNSDIEKYRIKTGAMGSDSSYGNNGLFSIRIDKTIFTVIISDGMGWEHVSISLEHRTPTWDEMCFIKDLFWSKDETVIQYHPKDAEYVNVHPNCLNLWKKAGVDHELPPKELIG